MQQEVNDGYQTPKKTANNLFMNLTTNVTQNPTTAKKAVKHRPIFKKTQRRKNQYTETNMFNIFHGSFKEQQISDMNIYNEDFCGCEDSDQICEILSEELFDINTIRQMRKEYDAVLDAAEQQINRTNNIRKQNLFRNLPKNYPELYLSQINNLLKVINKNLTYSEFECLCWIQYHCKVEYFTYFLFTELKKSYHHFGKFKTKLDIELAVVERYTIFNEIKHRGLENVFEKLLEEFYQSIGAKFVPITVYARFLELLHQKGVIIMCKLIKLFLTENFNHLLHAMVYLNQGNIEAYRNYLHTLNWTIILQKTLSEHRQC